MLTANILRALACLFMLSDHLWATVIPGNMWMTYVGRLAFPIFAFLIAEGYTHTSDCRAYMKRLLLFALISEIPFNLMYSSSAVFPFYQNVLFTLLLGLCSIQAIDRAWEHPDAKSVFTAGLIVFACILGGMFGFTDYGHWGVLTVIGFFVSRKLPFSHLLQLVLLIYINCFALKGLTIPVQLFGATIEFATQGFAVLSLLPIWLYSGQKGHSCKILQYGFYAFYPAHMLVLSLIRLLI